MGLHTFSDTTNFISIFASQDTQKFIFIDLYILDIKTINVALI